MVINVQDEPIRCLQGLLDLAYRAVAVDSAPLRIEQL